MDELETPADGSTAYLNRETGDLYTIQEEEAGLAEDGADLDEFSRSIGDSDLRGELQNAIRGVGAFRCFKDALHRRRIQESWYSYKTAALGQIAADWLDEHGISYTRDEGAAPTG